MNKEVFETIFNQIDTYAELPLMLEKVAYDVTNSEFDVIKNHSIAYHISGMVDIVKGIRKALVLLDIEVIILGLDLENEMDQVQFRKYEQLREFLKEFDNE